MKSPKTNEQDEENIYATHNIIEKVIIPHSDNRKTQEDDNVVIYDDIAAGIGNNYIKHNVYKSNVANFDGDKYEFNMKNENHNFRQKISLARARHKKNHKHKSKKKRTTKIKTNDTLTHYCPNFKTYLYTIFSNVKREITSWFQ